jgi:hypothetical protein
MNLNPLLKPRMALIRFLSALVFGVGLFMQTAPAASAHSASNAPASNYVSRIQSITPKPTTWKARVIEAGSRLEVEWLSGAELTMADYAGDPYLRVGRDGVFENMQSPATYINRDRQGSTSSTPIPENLKPEGPPQWRQVSKETVARIHWHPIHYMGSEPPPQVKRNPKKEHLVQTYDPPVSIVQGSVTYEIKGDVRWIPGPSPVVPLVVGGAFGLLVAGSCIMLRRTNRMAKARTVFAVAMFALIVVDALHLLGIAFGVEGGSGAGRVLGIGWVSVVAWVMGLGSLIALLKGKFDALYICVFAAGIMTLVGGLSDLQILSVSSVAFAFSLPLARYAIALTIGLGVALIVTGVILTGVRSPEGDDLAFDESPALA